ncbi:MAG: radical SAM/SPASM domain-containing protein [Bacteroidia bacterium]
MANAAKVLESYYRSRYTGIPKMNGMPFSISVEPTTSCNLRCPECPSGLRSFSRPTGMLNLDIYQKIVDELSDYLIYLILYFQGEPYLNRQLFDFIRYASERRVYTAISTNAHYLTPTNARKTVESGLLRLIISIDGTTQETYQNYRIGGKLDKVLEGTKNLIEAKKELKSKTPYTIFQFLVVKPNEHQINEVKALAKEYGVDYVAFKSAQVYEYEQGNPLIPLNEKYSRYKKQADGTYTIKNKLLNHCWKMWHSCVFTWDGKVVPCCFDKDATHQMGSIANVPFKEIWHSEDYNHFRRSILKGRNQIDICTNCTEGTKVWV